MDKIRKNQSKYLLPFYKLIEINDEITSYNIVLEAVQNLSQELKRIWENMQIKLEIDTYFTFVGFDEMRNAILKQ